MRLLALGGVAVGAVVTFDQVKASREVRSIDLFNKAIDLLASDEVLVRQGGVYALEQLSGLDKHYRGHAHALLTDDIGAAMAALGRQKMVVDELSASRGVTESSCTLARRG